MIKVFGVLDLIAAIIFVLVQWGIGVKIGFFVAAYLIIKSLMFIGDIASIVDLIAGVYLVLVLLGVHSAFSVVFVLWLLQKAFFSLAF